MVLPTGNPYAARQGGTTDDVATVNPYAARPGGTTDDAAPVDPSTVNPAVKYGVSRKSISGKTPRTVVGAPEVPIGHEEAEPSSSDSSSSEASSSEEEEEEESADVETGTAPAKSIAEAAAEAADLFGSDPEKDASEPEKDAAEPEKDAAKPKKSKKDKKKKSKSEAESSSDSGSDSSSSSSDDPDMATKIAARKKAMKAKAPFSPERLKEILAKVHVPAAYGHVAVVGVGVVRVSYIDPSECSYTPTQMETDLFGTGVHPFVWPLDICYLTGMESKYLQGMTRDRNITQVRRRSRIPMGTQFPSVVPVEALRNWLQTKKSADGVKHVSAILAALVDADNYAQVDDKTIMKIPVTLAALREADAKSDRKHSSSSRKRSASSDTHKTSEKRARFVEPPNEKRIALQLAVSQAVDGMKTCLDAMVAFSQAM